MKRAINHIGVLVPDIAEAARDYQKRFGYRLVGPTIHDVVQTAYVQFLEGATPGVLIELVSPDGPDSKLAGALKKGGGLNHLAYATDAIEKDCRELRSSGMRQLQEPVEAEAFPGGRIAWLMGRDGIPIELVSQGPKTLPEPPTISFALNSRQE